MPKKFTVSIEAPDKLVGADTPDAKPMDEAQITNYLHNLMDNHAIAKLKMPKNQKAKITAWVDAAVAQPPAKALVQLQAAQLQELFEKYEKLEAELQSKMGFAINTALEKIVTEYKVLGEKATAGRKAEMVALQKKHLAAMNAYIAKLKS